MKAKKQTKTIRFTVLYQGIVIDYQSVIEEKIGDKISKLSCYDSNFDMKSEINGFSVERDRAYFVPDCDYEIIIRPKKSKV